MVDRTKTARPSDEDMAAEARWQRDDSQVVTLHEHASARTKTWHHGLQAPTPCYDQQQKVRH
jgi:hypothetical protein